MRPQNALRDRAGTLRAYGLEKGHHSTRSGGGFQASEPVAGHGGSVFAAAAREFFTGAAGAVGVAGHDLGLFFQITILCVHGQ